MYRLLTQSCLLLFACGVMAVSASPSLGQDADRAPAPSPNNFLYEVKSASERIELTVNQSRILTLQQRIPRAQVDNPDVIKLSALAENQISISALKPGVTTVHIWGEDDQLHAIDIIVYGDVSELRMVLETNFPRATLEVRALANSVLISGFVDRADQVARIVEIAKDYYPKVINLINVGGVQQVLLHVKVMEVSRTGLRRLSTDFNLGNSSGYVVGSVAGLINSATAASGATSGYNGAFINLQNPQISNTDTLRFGVLGENNGFFGLIDALRRKNLVKVLAEPTLVAVSGRPAFFQEGGEFPVLVPQSLGTVSIEYKRFGTEVSFVPIVLGNGNIRLEVRPRVSEIDEARSVVINGNTVPGLRVREADTGVEMRAGQTLAMAGLIQERLESENAGLPILADIPYLGVPFRRVRENSEEVELLILVTPELVEALEPNEVPPYGPGQDTTAPTDHELYLKGYIEVPRLDQAADCPPGELQGYHVQQHAAPTYASKEQVPGLPPGARIVESHDAKWRPDASKGQAKSLQSAASVGKIDEMPDDIQPLDAMSSQIVRQSPQRTQPAGISSTSLQASDSEAASEAMDEPAGELPGLIGAVGYDVEE